MGMKKSMTAVLVILTLCTLGSAHAVLINNGSGFIYDTDLNITWYDYRTGGYTWSEAVAWAANLNVGGVTGWRLPTTPVSLSPDLPYSNTVDLGEMGHLYYVEGIRGDNKGLFPNSMADFTWSPGEVGFFWSGTTGSDYNGAPAAIAFNFSAPNLSWGGYGLLSLKTNYGLSLAVHDGNISPSGAIIDLGIFNGHQYFYDTGSFNSLDAARQAARAVPNRDLVSITSAAENDFLVTAITSMPNEASNLRCAWIGLFRPTAADPWGWGSGEAASYLNWRPAGVGFSWAEPTGETAGTMYINAPGNTIPLGLWADTYYTGSEAFNAIYETSDTIPVVVYDHFDDGVLDPAWSVTFDNATGWSYIESGSILSVTEIAPVGLGWSSVSPTMYITPIGDFSLNFDFSWDSSNSVRAMQNILVQLYDDLGNKLVAVGYSDGWIQASGAQYAMVGGSVFDSGPGSMPLAGSAHVQITRSGSAITVLWNGAQLFSGTGNTPVNRIELVFSYCNFSDSEGPSLFGSESVDWIEVRAFSEFDFDQDGDVDGSDLAELISLSGANIQQFAEVFGSVFGF
jgi:hypothetical protein